MQKLKIRIKLSSPLIISSQSGDSTLTQTLTHIPGTSMLGLLAGRYLRDSKNCQSFSRLFLRGDLHFQNLYPSKENTVYLPCPGNLWRSKTHPESFVNVLREPGAGNDYAKTAGYASFMEDYVDLYTPGREIFFHHERDYSKGISKSGVVFNYEALSTGQEFTGHILGSEEDLATIKALLEQDPALRIGKSKTSQYGNAQLIECEATELGVDEPETGDEPLMVLASDTIIRNAAGISTIDLADLESLLGVKIISASIETVRIETIVNAHKAKKPSARAFKAGSSFLLQKMPKAAAAFARHGLGERTWEGFGQIYFMGQFPAKLRLLSSEKSEYSLPASPPPALIKKLAEEVRTRVVSTLLCSKASQIAIQIGPRRLSNSLLGRLESFAGSGNFSQSFALLRELSLQKIRKIHLGDKSFDVYLKDIDHEIESLINSAKAMSFGSQKKLRDLIEEAGLPDLQPEPLKSLFLRTLFLNIRRVNNKHREAK
ncbi:MAG: hypothetical protein LHW58_09490 [Candidatus Cloacimonetes bacterium]|nr:hypothetical protein [Candidatus Cloacimonadota bacterium]